MIYQVTTTHHENEILDGGLPHSFEVRMNMLKKNYVRSVFIFIIYKGEKRSKS